MIRTLVVDDEPLARRKLLDFLACEADVEVVAECGGGAEAIREIEEHAPGLIFLDIQMPEVDGFQVLEALGPERAPEIIFVTAHDRFAIRAFELHALDYLLKPFARDRFRSSLDRARERMAHGRIGTDARILAFLEELRANQQRLEHLPVTVGRRTRFVRFEDTDWIESEGNYLRLHSAGKVHLVRGTMKTLEERIDPERFVRINRSTMVNLARVAEIIARGGGDYTVVLAGGTRLDSGWGYGRRLRSVLENPL